MAAPRNQNVEKLWRRQVKIWWIPIAQLLVTAAIAVCLVWLLDGYEALPDGGDSFWNMTKREKFRLRISEVTTLVSASMVIVKLLVSSWTAVAVSGCVFILLEEPGLKISALSRMMGFGLPMVWPTGGRGWAVAIVLLLLSPQPLIAPLVTGAVGWSAFSGPSEVVRNVTSISRTMNVTIPRGNTTLRICKLRNPPRRPFGVRPPTGPDPRKRQLGAGEPQCDDIKKLEFDGVSDEQWIEFRDWTVFLDTAVNTKLAPRQAAGLSAALWPPNEGGKLDRGVGSYACRTRVAAGQQPIPVNSTADSVDLPCILVRNITWTQYPEDIRNLTENTNQTTSEAQTQTRLSEYPVPGAAMIFNGTSESIVDLAPNGYSPDIAVQYPNSSMVTGGFGLLVQLHAFRKDIPKNATLNCTQHDLHNQTIFGSLQDVPDKAIFKSERGCYAYAVVELTCGRADSWHGQFQQNQVCSFGCPRGDFGFTPEPNRLQA